MSKNQESSKSTIGRADRNDVMELLMKGTARHFTLPSGRQIEIEVTGDTASITVTRGDNTFVVYNEDLDLHSKEEKWDITNPSQLATMQL